MAEKGTEYVLYESQILALKTANELLYFIHLKFISLLILTSQKAAHAAFIIAIVQSHCHLVAAGRLRLKRIGKFRIFTFTQSLYLLGHFIDSKSHLLVKRYNNFFFLFNLHLSFLPPKCHCFQLSFVILLNKKYCFTAFKSLFWFFFLF